MMNRRKITSLATGYVCMTALLSGISNGYSGVRFCGRGITEQQQQQQQHPRRTTTVTTSHSHTTSPPCRRRLDTRILSSRSSPAAKRRTTTTTTTTTSWTDMYQSLVSYKQQFNSTLVPRTYKSDPELWAWVNRQRAFYKSNALSCDRERQLEELEFVWDVWEDMYLHLVRYKEREGDCNVPQKHREDGKNLGVWLNNQRQSRTNGQLDRGLERRLTKLGVVWDIQGQKWEDMFALLVQYKEREGDCNVPQKHKEDGKSLGVWLNNQRQSQTNGRRLLDTELEDRLNRLGVVWDIQGQRWDDMYTLLLQYKAREGNCNVPFNHKEDDQNLGMWLNNQRKAKKSGKLESQKEKRLGKINVVWSRKSNWDWTYELLEQYKRREGNCDVPFRHKEDGQNLGSWLSKQREHKKNGKLEPEREKRLEQLGVVWSPHTSKWDDMYSLLEQYKSENGHCNVPQKHRKDGQNLGNWVMTQCKDRRNGKLEPTRQQRLEELGVVWSRRNACTWEAMYGLLKQYTEREGNCNVPDRHTEQGKNLGFWLVNQRTSQTNGKMDPQRERRLTELGVVWSRRTNSWDAKYSLLERYKEREGHCNVPLRHKEDDEKLGMWLSNQRRAKNSGKIDPKRARLLDDIGVQWRINAKRQ